MSIETTYAHEVGLYYTIDTDTYDGLVDGNRIMGVGITLNESVEDFLNLYIDFGSLEVENVCGADSPDFVDAYISSGQSVLGFDLNDELLDLLGEYYPSLANEMLHGG